MTNARTVLVPAGRVVRWFDNFGTRHGTTSSVVSSGCLSVSAADGATALAALPFGAQYDGAADATAFAHAVLAVAESKVGQRHVQGRTKAGGQSQQRFARRRDNQARQAYEAAAEHAARILTGRLTALVCGGDRSAVDAVLSDPRLVHLVDVRVEPWLAVPDPRRSVLDQAVLDGASVSIEVA